MQLKLIQLADYKPHPMNSNTHPQEQLTELSNSHEMFGQYKNVVVWNGYYLAGHGYKEAAEARGETELYAIDMSHLSAEEATALIEADNETARMSIIDEVKRAEALASLSFNPPGFDDDKMAALSAGLSGIGEAGEIVEDEPQIDKGEELQAVWKVETGDLWQLGRHRLICGDCTDKATVDRLMGGERADLMVTDPPYGVSYASKNEFLNNLDKGNRVQTEIENDHLSIEDTAEFLWKPAFTVAHDVLNNVSSFYCFMPQGGDQMMMMMMMMSEGGLIPRHELIWVKNNHVLGRVDYCYKHEPIIYGWKRKGTHKYYGGFQTSILEFNKPNSSKLHPTMKPIELIAKLITNSNLADQLVYDPFLGSGTTLIAAHQTNRICFGSEISPKYCAVILQRYADLTGETPIKS